MKDIESGYCERLNSRSRGHQGDCLESNNQESFRNTINCKDSSQENSSDCDDSSKNCRTFSKWCRRVNKRVLVPKAFYASFYTGIGALFPYLPVYFKQLHLTPHQTGVLIGVRPLIQFLATPIWGAVADKFCKGKAILLMSVLGWLVSNALLALAPETKHTRICEFTPELEPLPEKTDDPVLLLRRFYGNRTFYGLYGNGNLKNGSLFKRNSSAIQNRTKTFSGGVATHVQALFSAFPRELNDKVIGLKTLPRKSHAAKEGSRNSSKYHFVATSRYERPWTLVLMEDEPATLLHGNVTSEDHVFTYLFLVTVIGTLVSAPTHMMADTATLTTLDGQLHKYGGVRLWGSLGWGVGGFSVGAAVSSNLQTRCNGEVIIDYFPCFYVYIVAMAAAFICATQFKYNTEALPADACDKPGIKNALVFLRCPENCFVLVIAFFCGSATGFIETFLFWYLHELGGDQFLFSVINGMNCAAEVLVFLITDKMIDRIGQVCIIYLALACYALRFLYFYFLTSPWWVLPAELLQGVTTAALWASCVSYVGLHPGASHTLQGILNGVYMGLGFAAGGFIGGMIVHLVGIPDSFLIFATVSLLLLFVFFALNKARRK